MNFFFDRCVGVRLARMLDAFDGENTITHQDDDNRFTIKSKDIDIITTIAADDPKPVYITADLANRTVKEERAALRDSGMTLIFLRSRFHHIKFHIQAVKLLTLWPDIAKTCERCAAPTAFEITPAANKPQYIGLTKDL